MKQLVVLIGCAVFLSGLGGCQTGDVRNVKNIDYSRIAGTWKAEKSPWQIVISKDGLVESAIFPMGEAMVIPNKTTYIDMKDGSKSSYKSGDFPLYYYPERSELEVTIKVEKIHIKFLDNEIKGSNETLFVGAISEDGKQWDAVIAERFDYGPRFPQGEITPKLMKFIKISN